MQSWTPRNAQMSYAENNDLITPYWQVNKSILCLYKSVTIELHIVNAYVIT